MSTKYIKKQEKNITKIAKYINKKGRRRQCRQAKVQAGKSAGRRSVVRKGVHKETDACYNRIEVS
ncbi:hypothetical protein DW709_07565 [Coprococcus sp. AM27-12LB]|nr:hypothetical protein DW709_07565 [Coprococcus sp. AM27-12LB]